jgi:hypothetical protein
MVEYAEAELSKAHEFLELPQDWTEHPPEFFDGAGRQNGNDGSHSSRLALGCVLLSGKKGRIAATDGRQIYMHDGFTFGWE